MKLQSIDPQRPSSRKLRRDQRRGSGSGSGASAADLAPLPQTSSDSLAERAGGLPEPYAAARILEDEKDKWGA